MDSAITRRIVCFSGTVGRRRKKRNNLALTVTFGALGAEAQRRQYPATIPNMGKALVHSASQALLIAPDIECKRSARYFHVLSDNSSADPAALFVEPRGAIIANRAGKPRGIHSALIKTSLSIGD